MPYDFSNVFSLLLFCNTAFSVALAVYVSQLRSGKVSRGLVGILVAAGIWSVADGLRIAAPTTQEVLFWNQVTYIGAGLIVPSTVLFVASYTGSTRWLSRRRFGVIVGISAVMIPIVFVNPDVSVGLIDSEGLWRTGETVNPGSSPPVLETEFGLAHVLWVVYVLLGIIPLIYVLLIRSFRQTDSRVFRQQIRIMLVGFTAPVVGSALFVIGSTPVDLTPVGFTVFGVAVTVAITQYRILDLVPVARDTVVTNADVGVFVLDHDDRVVDVNPRGATILEADHNTIVGRPAGDVFGGHEEVHEAIRTHEEGSTTVRIEDGTTRHYNADFSTIRDANGNSLGRVVTFNEITEQVTREQRLVDQTETLTQQNERLDQFASMVSHDLRNPLNLARLRVEQAQESDDEALEKALESLDRMDRMIEQLLTLSRMEHTTREVDSVQLRQVVTLAWESVAPEEATLNAESGLGEVQAQEGLAIELFENLFRNAVEHNDEPVTVTVGRLDDAGFFVADDGTGIPADDHDEIFSHGHTTGAGNTGFGLSIVADIADAYDWAVTVCDAEGGGARFEFRTDPEA